MPFCLKHISINNIFNLLHLFCRRRIYFNLSCGCRDLFSELTVFEWSGVDDGVDGSDEEESDVDDVGLDGDEFFKY